MKKKQTSKQRAQEFITNRKNLLRFFFMLNTIVWLVIGVLLIIEMLIAKNTVSTVLVAIFLLFNVLTLLVGSKLLDQKEKWVFIVLLVIPVLNMLLSFTGYPSFLYIFAFILDVCIILTVISLKKHYL